MQNFCIWETGYKIPKIDRVKVRCKNSASEKLGYKIPKIDCIKLRYKNSAAGKLDTKYLKSTTSRYDAKILHLINWIQNT